MTKSRLVKDNNNDIYLEVFDKSLDKPTYFKVELFATEPEGKIINLTKQEMIVDLSGKI
jgi:hypothetical protein